VPRNEQVDPTAGVDDGRVESVVFRVTCLTPSMETRGKSSLPFRSSPEGDRAHGFEGPVQRPLLPVYYNPPHVWRGRCRFGPISPSGSLDGEEFVPSLRNRG